MDIDRKMNLYSPKPFLDNKRKNAWVSIEDLNTNQNVVVIEIKKKKELFQGRGWIKGIQSPSLYRKKKEKENKIVSLI